MFSKMVLWFVLIAPWFTLFLIKKDGIKRYFPVAIFVSFLMLLYNLVAYNLEHWVINVTIIPWLKPAFVSGILGIFPILTIWIFYFTFGRFWVYLLTNIIVDFMFAVFPIHYVFQEKLGIYQLVNITPWGRFGLFIMLAIIIYGYHAWLEDVFKYKLTR